MPNYLDCTVLGDSGVELVMAWLLSRGRVYKDRMVRTDKGRIALRLQATVGDVLYNADQKTIMSIEVKTERRESPNLFLETWSNATSGREKEGWMLTLDADWLFYYFSDSDALWVLDFQLLKRWAFRGLRQDGSGGRLFDFPEKEQKANFQLNLTRGRCVPVAVLVAEVGAKRYSPMADLQKKAAS